MPNYSVNQNNYSTVQNKYKPEVRWPNNVVPWVEQQLPPQVVDHLWKMVKDGEENYQDAKKTLIGNISKSFILKDKDDYFMANALHPAFSLHNEAYPQTMDSLEAPKILTKDGEHIYPSRHRLELENFWANYQYKHEFNPKHNHSGLYSFVVWLKIPYDCKEQRKLDFLKGTGEGAKLAGTFKFHYLDQQGKSITTVYDLNKSFEGTMLLFPSWLHHEVHPFYETDEKRVSLSGNIDVVWNYDRDLT